MYGSERYPRVIAELASAGLASRLPESPHVGGRMSEQGIAPTHSLEAAASSSVERMASSGSVLLRDIAECWHALAAALYGSTLGGRTVFVYAIGPPERYKGQLRSGVQIKKQEARSEKLD